MSGWLTEPQRVNDTGGRASRRCRLLFAYAASGEPIISVVAWSAKLTQHVVGWHGNPRLAICRPLSVSRHRAFRRFRSAGSVACPGPAATPPPAPAAWAAIRELSKGFRSPLPEPPHPLRRSATRVSAPYLGGSTTTRGHSLAGYQLLWKALPIARSEETTVKAQ